MEDNTDYSVYVKPEFFKEYMLLKTDPLKFLFDGVGKLSVFAEKNNGEIYEFSVYVKHPSDIKKPWDCKISCAYINKFFRTENGENGIKYESFDLMMKDIKRLLQSSKNKICVKVKYYEFSINHKPF